MGYGTTKLAADGSGYINTIKGGVAISISMCDIARQMRRVRDQLPKLRSRAFKTQMKTILSRMQKAMAKGGGIYDVPKFASYEDFTRQLRRADGLNPNGPIGGWLSKKGSFKYDALTPFTSPRPKVRIGWLEGAESAAIKFQTGAGTDPDQFTQNDFRYAMHRRLGTETLPSAYVHHQRQLIVPFERHVTVNLQKWIDGYVRKTLANQIVREIRRAS